MQRSNEFAIGPENAKVGIRMAYQLPNVIPAGSDLLARYVALLAV